MEQEIRLESKWIDYGWHINVRERIPELLAQIEKLMCHIGADAIATFYSNRNSNVV